MSKKKKENKSQTTDMSDNDLKKLANMVGSMKNVTVLKIGNDKLSDTEQIERYRRSNKQLRGKVEKNISEIVKLEAEIRELQADAYLNTDEGAKAVNKKLRQQKKELKEQLERLITDKNTILDKLTELRKDHINLKTEKNNLTKEVEELKFANKNFDKEVEELRKELNVRIQEDSRFKNMDF